MTENNNDFSSGWYAPLGEKKPYAPPPPKKASRKGRFIALFAVITALLAAITVALVYGSANDEPPALANNSKGPEWRQVLDEYYGGGSQISVDLDRAEGVTGFTLSYSPAGEQLSLQDISDKCLPSIVFITADRTDGDGRISGTGIIASEDGLILTNAHIVEECDRAIVTLNDGREFDAYLVGADSRGDVCLLKIEAEELTAAQFADSNESRVGDSVCAIGNPLGSYLRGTMTNGIISAINRDVPYNGNMLTLLQTNAAINEGNSGGALVDMYGRVIGITNMKIMSSYTSVEGIGFAIPTASISAIIDGFFIEPETPTGPILGITVGAIPEMFSSYYEIPAGLYVSEVTEGTDAFEKGIRQGDIITSANGKALSVTQDLVDEKAGLAVGESISLSVWREGERFTVDVKLVDAADVN